VGGGVVDAVDVVGLLGGVAYGSVAAQALAGAEVIVVWVPPRPYRQASSGGERSGAG
jgi:hypothetical protein